VLTVYNSSSPAQVYKSAGHLEFLSIPDAGSTLDVGGTTYTFVNGAAGADQIQVDGGQTLSQVVAALRDQVNADLVGTPARVKSSNSTVLIIEGDTANPAIAVQNISITTSSVAATRQTADFIVEDRDTTAAALTFNADGLPQSFNAAAISVLGFSSGAADMNDVDLDGDGIIDVPRMALDFGTVGDANGMTQFGAGFAITFIQQDGARFGTFSGVTISEDGLVTALFDNGELRPIYRVPLATFVNPNGLQAQTGNIWNATQASGDATLRNADDGLAGQIVQASLESSTVDIGEEFTNMIIVQRAYSAATRIISTADQMLEELVRIKR